MTKENIKRAYELLIKWISASEEYEWEAISQLISASNKEVQDIINFCFENEFLTKEEIEYVLGLREECPDDIRRIM